MPLTKEDIKTITDIVDVRIEKLAVIVQRGFDSVQSDIGNIKSDIKSMRSDIQTLNDKLDAITDEINYIKQRLNEIDNNVIANNKRSLEDDNAISSIIIDLRKRVVRLENQVTKLSAKTNN